MRTRAGGRLTAAGGERTMAWWASDCSRVSGSAPARNAATPGGCRGRSRAAGSAACPRWPCGGRLRVPRTTPVTSAPWVRTSRREPNWWKASRSARSAAPTTSPNARAAAARRPLWTYRLRSREPGCWPPSSTKTTYHSGRWSQTAESHVPRWTTVADRVPVVYKRAISVNLSWRCSCSH